MAKLTHTRAKAGGEIGMNGERYEGGQFLPSTTLPKMTVQQKRKGSGKQEIAPYVWEVAPAENQRSLYKMIETLTTLNNGRLEAIDNPKAYNYFGETKEAIQKLANKWNAGERWVTV